MRNCRQIAITGAIIALAGSIGGLRAGAAANGQTIYSDSLQNGWQPWGWATINYNNARPVHGGRQSIAVTIKKGYDALYIHHSAFSTAGYQALTFWVNGGAKGGQVLQIQATANKKPVKYVILRALAANKWIKVSVPLSALAVTNRKDVDGFWIEDGSGKPLATFYVDDIALTK